MELSQQNSVIHYPNLKTILIVENILKNTDSLITKEELKRRLPMQIMHQTLNLILQYLDEKGMILDGRKGILWIYNPSSKLKNAIKSGVEI